jgi:hypothetical protein
MLERLTPKKKRKQTLPQRILAQLTSLTGGGAKKSKGKAKSTGAKAKGAGAKTKATAGKAKAPAKRTRRRTTERRTVRAGR